MSKVSEEAFLKFCREEGKLEPTGNRRRIWNGAIAFVLEQAKALSMAGIDCDKAFPELSEERFVRISELEDLFKEETK